MQLLPKARTSAIIEQVAGDDLLIYDLRIDKAYNLNETSKAVFRACDGATSFEDLQQKMNFSAEVIYLALDELRKNNLLEGDYASPFGGMNRREVIRKVGLASMVALPIVAGIAAPSAASAASGATQARGQTCTATSQCVSSNRCATTNGGVQRCCADTNTRQPQEPGTNLGNTNNATCTGTIGPQFCCSGSATNNPPGTQGCVCN